MIFILLSPLGSHIKITQTNIVILTIKYNCKQTPTAILCMSTYYSPMFWNIEFGFSNYLMN